MDEEMMRKQPAQTLVFRRPTETHVIRARTKQAVLRELQRLTKRGYIADASALAEFHARAGGGYGVKVVLTKPLPQPMPSWAKGLALVGGALSVFAVAATILINAIAALIGAAAVLPWAVIIGGAAVVGVLLLLAKRAVSGGSISVTQNVTIKR